MSDPGSSEAFRRPPIARRAGGSSSSQRPAPTPVYDSEPEPAAYTPGVWTGLRVFCLFICLTTIPLAYYCIREVAEKQAAGNAGTGLVTEYVVYLTLTLTAFVLFSVPLWVRTPQPWVWWYGLTLIVLSLLTLYLAVFGLVLLVFWLLPGTRSFFAASVESPVEVSS